MLQELIDGAARLGVPLAPAAAGRLLRLLDELERWNRSFNLTAITDRREMLTHHLLDSLSVLPFVQGARVIDVGTGAGFPGLPLAIADPGRHYTLLDSAGKKVRFVSHACRVLGLANVEPVHARAEAWRPDAAFDTVVARAFAPLPRLVAQVAPLCRPDTRVVAMKGPRAADEQAGLPAGWQVEQDVRVEVPGLGAERRIVVLRPPPAGGMG